GTRNLDDDCNETSNNIVWILAFILQLPRPHIISSHRTGFREQGLDSELEFSFIIIGGSSVKVPNMETESILSCYWAGDVRERRRKEKDEGEDKEKEKEKEGEKG